MKFLIAIFLFTAGLASAQCKLVPNPDTGLLDCAGVGATGPAGANGEVTDEALQSGRHLRCADAGANDTYTCTMTPAPTSYVAGNPGTDGQLGNGTTIAFKPNTANTGAATLTIGGLAAKAIKQTDGTTDPADGTLAAGRWYLLTYDGTSWQLPAGSSATSGVTSIAGTSQQIALSAATGSVVVSIPNNPLLPGTTTGTFSGNLTGNVTGNATTATTANTASAISSGAITGLTEDTAANPAADFLVTYDVSASALKQVKPNNLGLDTSTRYCADAGSNDTYACSLSPVPAAYVNGALYRFKANTANTGAATVNFNSLGAKTIVKVAGGVTTTLADNDIRVGQIVDLSYDGTNMQMQSTLGNAASGSGSAFSSTVAVSFSATPTFTVPSSTTTGATFEITLTGNVTSSTLASATNGQMLNWIICQDATGGRSFVWPTNVVNGATISAARNSAPSMCVKQTFAYDGTNAYGDREIVVGGSGALTIDANNQIDFTSGVTPSLAGNNTYTGLNYFQNFLRIPNSNTPPAGDCDDAAEQGRLYVDNDASTGQKLYVCKGATGWEQQGGGSASELGGASSYAFLQTFDPVMAGSVAAANAISPSASQIYFYRMVVPHKLSITKASFYQGNDVASSKFGIGIYDSSLARVYQTGAVDGASGSGGRVVTTSIVTLNPDVYIVAWAASDITQTMYSGALGTVGVTGNLGSVPISGTASGTFSTSTGMPATISSLSGAGVNVPFITFTQ